MTLWKLVSDAGFADMFVISVCSTFMTGFAVGALLINFLRSRR